MARGPIVCHFLLLFSAIGRILVWSPRAMAWKWKRWVNRRPPEPKSVMWPLKWCHIESACFGCEVEQSFVWTFKSHILKRVFKTLLIKEFLNQSASFWSLIRITISRNHDFLPRWFDLCWRVKVNNLPSLICSQSAPAAGSKWKQSISHHYRWHFKSVDLPLCDTKTISKKW